MYATINDLKAILPSPITIGDNNIGTPSPGAPASRSCITTSEANYFIGRAQNEIDARLRAFYQCPLRRTKIFETALTNDIVPGTNVVVNLRDSGAFMIGDAVRIQGSDIMDNATVVDIPSIYSIKIDTLANTYSQADGCLVSLIKYPDPIPLMAARLAVALAFDELFSAEQSPNVSSYGNTQRQLANNSLDSILDGTVKLFGQEWTGRRFIRGSLFDAYKNPVKDFAFGREKTSAGGG